MLATYLARPVGAGPAMLLAGAIGLLYAFVLFGPTVVLDTGTFWLLPRGPSGGFVDARIGMSGYYWFVQDAWRWPLLAIPQPNGGSNAVLFDAVPLLALPAKLWRTLTGQVVDLFPYWTGATFALNAAALAALVRGLGQRSLLAAGVAGALGAMAPVVHHRFGHLGLGAHWLFVFALATYAAWLGRRRRRGEGMRAPAAVAILVALGLIGFACSLYLYVMVAAIAAAALLQAAAGRRITWMGALAGLVGVLAAGAAPLDVFGLLDRAQQLSGGSVVPFGEQSMNLVAPFWPQSSGAFAWTGLYALTRGSIGATNGQSDAYCYLGLGALVLLAVALLRSGWALPGLVRGHWALALALLVLTVWAVSNQVYLGPRLVLTYPVPDALLTTVLAWFRASGRFFWPVAWTLVALGIVGALARLRPGPALLVGLLAVTLQWIDLSIWRGRLREATAEPAASAFGSLAASAGLQARIAAAGRVALAPSQMCSATSTTYAAPQTEAAIEIQLLAARANAVMPAVAMARAARNCERERATPVADLAADGLLIALDQAPHRDRTAEARETLDCEPIERGWLCARRTEKEP